MILKLHHLIFTFILFAAISVVSADEVVKTQEGLSPFGKKVIEDNKENLRWIEGCSRSPVSTYRLKNDLVIFATNLGLDNTLIQCLLPEVSKDLSNQKAFIFASPIAVLFSGEGKSYPRPDAFLQTGGKAIIVTSTGSDRGVTQIKHVSEDTFIIQTGYSTHRRAYLVFGNSNEVKYLTNGDVKVVDTELLIFRVDFRKSWFRGGGAFWFDALIDRNGEILDIVTPMPDGGDSQVECMSSDELTQKSFLDLSRFSNRTVCVYEK